MVKKSKRNEQKKRRIGYNLFCNDILVKAEPKWTEDLAMMDLLNKIRNNQQNNYRGYFFDTEMIPIEVEGEYILPPSVSVLPLFFVPRDENNPTEPEKSDLIKHLSLTKNRYAELLLGNTFEIAEEHLMVFHANYRLHKYLELNRDHLYSQIAGELLNSISKNRYSCPYILVTIFHCPNYFPKSEFDGPYAGFGRPFNGGYSTGGGICVFPSFQFNIKKNFQSTLQHEIGHAFGLPHVDVYGYDMMHNESIMSYNQAHHTYEFTLSLTPGIFIKEDLQGLALNNRVFPGLNSTQTQGTESEIKVLDKLEIVGQPDQIIIRTNSGETCGSKVSNIFQNIIYPSVNLGENNWTFNSKYMWHSDTTETGWVSIDFAFPQSINLSGLGIHSQHSGKCHEAKAIRISTYENDENFSLIGEFGLDSIDQKIDFEPTSSKKWKFEFKAAESKKVVIRGLQFFSGENEIYPPLIPWKFE